MKVTFLNMLVNSYRVRFHALVQEHLVHAGIDYLIATGQPPSHLHTIANSAFLPQYHEVKNIYIELLRKKCVLQLVSKDILDCDLLIIQQENKLLTNYVLQTVHRSKRRRIAFWGHGRNFSAADPDSPGERWRRFWARKADWWFAYTEECGRHIASLGFPEDRITVFNNAIDTRAAALLSRAVTADRKAARRAELGLTGSNTAIFVGGLYPGKRLDFLIAAADRLRAAIPDFELIIVGGGVDAPLAAHAAASRPWIKVVGTRFDADKAELMALAKVFLMPGLVGLAILDAGAAGLPLATTDYPFHSPEIAYLEEGVSGVISRPWTSVDAYATMVEDLLTGDPARLEALSDGARRMAETHTIEEMASRFSNGVLRALVA